MGNKNRQDAIRVAQALVGLPGWYESSGPDGGVVCALPCCG